MEDAHRLGGLSGIVDEDLEGFIDGVRDEFGEVSGFWVVGAQEAVVAFNGAFLPGAKGGVVVVGDGGVGRVDGDDIGDILIAIVHQESGGLAILPATQAVEGHRDDLRPSRPTDRPVLGVVLHRPNAGLGLDEGLISYLTHTHGHMYSDIAVEHQRQKSSGLISSISIHLSRSIQLVKYNSISSFLSQIARKRENSSKPLASSLIWRKTCST